MSPGSGWMLYGAYGYTGAIITEEAVRRGHRPVLAGRDSSKLEGLAKEYGLEYRVLSLENEETLTTVVAQFDLILHAAGPFIHTSAPMVRACLAGRTHYLDITGEIPVFENIFSLDSEAVERGTVLIGGVGFDVVPSDCLSGYLANKHRNAISLELAFSSPGRFSPGTAKTAVEGLPKGGVRRRDSRYEPYPLGAGVKEIQFSDGQSSLAMPIPWGDLATAYRTTGIRNITTYMTISSRQERFLPYISIVQRLLTARLFRSLAQRFIDLLVHGPDETARQQGRSFLWAQVTDTEGGASQAWLETLEPYRLTAYSSVRAVEKVLSGEYTGAMTPFQAFGPDFVLELGDTSRYDKLQE
ncbi:MAG TPA: saccharopine dehydrogenase NADP-binding domain-containing protein [candidate division Zixibacteria bacterium]|nr:saccharopine dehydrogenase NADP-binding domain-containing protein [candidate division Zixibacteria bacterium]